MRRSPVRFIVLSLSVSMVPLLAAAPAHAALIATDWLSPGDGLAVRDTTSGLEWLNLTQTANLSYAQVSAELGAGGGFESWRYASNAEVVDLFGDYFGINLNSDWYGEIPAFVDPGVRLASETLGDGVSTGSDEYVPNANYRLIGYTADTRLNGHHFVLGARSRWTDTDYFTAMDPVQYHQYNVWDPYPLVTSDLYADPWIGSYLVRPAAVPLPAAAWLLGSGLLLLAGGLRRKASP